jgi:hypothetical protein
MNKPTLVVKNAAQLAKQAGIRMAAVQKEVLNAKNLGFLVGKAAWKVTKPSLKFWDGVKNGFNSGKQEVF